MTKQGTSAVHASYLRPFHQSCKERFAFQGLVTAFAHDSRSFVLRSYEEGMATQSRDAIQGGGEKDALHAENDNCGVWKLSKLSIPRALV